MTVAAAPTGNNLRLWVASGAVVLGLHAAGAALLVTWHDPVAIGEPSSAIVVDLAPFTTPPSNSQEDIAPGPKQQEMNAPPPEPQEVEKSNDEKVDVPPTPEPAVAALPPPEPVERPAPPVPPVPMTTAPPRQRVASAAEITSWHRRIVAQIERHKTYPEAARSHREKGVVQIAFSIDRQGRVTAHHVAQPSGYAALDEAAMATVTRAQPFPPPPDAMSGDSFNFTVPVQFSIR